jgi:hypothetical protein
MREKVYSSFTCYCGFKNSITFKMPNLNSKEWLVQDCLACNAKYDIRIYPHENTGSVNVHKRLITSSEQVDRAIEGENEKRQSQAREVRKDSESH